METHSSLIHHSSTANGMHVYETMLVWSSSTSCLTVYSPLSKKKAEKCANAGIQYLRWTNLCNKQHFHCIWDTTMKTSKRNIIIAEDTRRKQVSSLPVCVIGPTWALTWLLNWVSATCWGGYMSQMLQKAATQDMCHWNHIQITSNRNTDDFCLHKCFSLGLSWLCIFNWLIIWKMLDIIIYLKTLICHQHYPNTSPDLTSECSKCYLLG